MRSLHAMRLIGAILPVLWAVPAPAQTAAGARTAPSRPAAVAQAQPQAPGQAQVPDQGQGQVQASAPTEQFVDGIAAVVNKDVITLRELNARVVETRQELAQQNIQAPPHEVLQRQVLQRLIMERLEQQEAARLNIRVTDEQVDQAIQSIANRNKLPAEEMRKKIEASGTTWDAYRSLLRQEIRLDRLRQRTVDRDIIITDAEVDAFLKEQQARRSASGSAGAGRPAPAAAVPTAMTLAQILVRVPEGASPEQVATLRKKAEDLLARARGGADFASLAAATSDGPEALQGGNMGTRPIDGWPDLFVKAVASLQTGQVSDLIQSGNGFHILKVLDRRDPASAQAPTAAPQAGPPGGAPEAPPPQGPMPVTQTHARHILIKTSAVMSDDQARTRLEQLRQRIVQGGESFADLARRYSSDSTAPQGGDLGWVNPGETVPPFEQAMNALQPGEISQPVQSPFGWHLILVEGRRTQDMAEEYQRMQARQILFERRAEPAFQEWLDQLRDQAYIDNRLERQDRVERGDNP